MAFVCGAWQLLICYQPAVMDVHTCVLRRGIHQLFNPPFILSLKTCCRLLQVWWEEEINQIHMWKPASYTHTQDIFRLSQPNTHSSHRLFKEVPLLQGECVGLGDDGDDVDHLTETSHELHIQRPQTGGRDDRTTSFHESFLSCIFYTVIFCTHNIYCTYVRPGRGRFLPFSAH